MIKKLIVGACAIGIVGYLGTVAYLYNYDAKRSERLISSAAPKGDAHIREIFYQRGCEYCHTSNADMPFYASFPIAKQLMEHDVKMGFVHFNLTSTMNSLINGTAAPEADLAKIERVMQDQVMPPTRYTAMHWSGSVSSEDRTAILDWAKQQRAKYYVTQGVSADFQNEIVQPLPEPIATDAKKVALGSILYHDNRLSGDNTLSCETCHKLDGSGVDSLVTSKGINGQMGPINAPTVFNAVYNVEQFWDGRAKDLQEQAGGPPLNPIEMGSESWDQIIGKLAKDPALTAAFIEVYPAGFSAETITDAIAEFEKTLVTPNSPFDRYMKGDENALTAQQKNGFKLFKDNKCGTCHVGKNLGGQSFEMMGLKEDYFAGRGHGITEVDLGRFNFTTFERDRFRFKVPTLRNIELTGPYLHDGSIDTLKGAVDMMLKYQLETTLPEKDVDDMVEFLKSLTGEYKLDQPTKI
ncbi:Cytochrome c551 peroxidase precursor [Pragia fontium]|uniref:Cytochrome-c peroxidase n=1 Tax=Pragia fontium TaxID=82985 RepID=A0ABQ5LHK3_9GAMM|nr:cytochrome c peroxidase [Pragia fontium]GKX63088.1 cytochrome-c peroxidase [Pragia fontium]SUB81789.1 Cytochrome c551 peroxidase precursor [Pragia fontium]